MEAGPSRMSGAAIQATAVVVSQATAVLAKRPVMQHWLLEVTAGDLLGGCCLFEDVWLQGESCMSHADMSCPSSCSCEVNGSKEILSR